MSGTKPKSGDQVRLLAVPDWLLKDLPMDEQREIKSFVGKTAVILEVDSYGYFWVGFGETQEGENAAYYSGHSFCVPEDCLSLL